MRSANQKARWSSSSALLRYATRNEVQECQSQVRFRLTPEDEDLLSAEAPFTAPGRVAEDHAKMVEEAMILALRWPHLVGPAIVSICERVLRTPGLRPTAY